MRRSHLTQTASQEHKDVRCTTPYVSSRGPRPAIPYPSPPSDQDPYEGHDEIVWRQLKIKQFEQRQQERYEELMALQADDTSSDESELDANHATVDFPHSQSSSWQASAEGQRSQKRKRTMPPPTSPENGSKRLKTDHDLQDSRSAPQVRLTAQELRKRKRIAPRRPTTRSMVPERIALHDVRGNVRVWGRMSEKYIVMKHEDYYKNFAPEGPLDAERQQGANDDLGTLDQYERTIPDPDFRKPFYPQSYTGLSMVQHENQDKEQIQGRWPFGDRPSIGWRNLRFTNERSKSMKQNSKRFRKLLLRYERAPFRELIRKDLEDKRRLRNEREGRRAQLNGRRKQSEGRSKANRFSKSPHSIAITGRGRGRPRTNLKNASTKAKT